MGVGVKVVLVVMLMLSKRVGVFENVIKIEVEGLVVLPEVVVIGSTTSSMVLS